MRVLFFTSLNIGRQNTQVLSYRSKNSPPDCFLYALTVLKEIITLSTFKELSSIWEFFFLRSSRSPRFALHRRIVESLRFDSLLTLFSPFSLLWAVSLVKNDSQSFFISLPSSQRDNFDLWSNTKNAQPLGWAFFIISLRTTMIALRQV